MPEMSEATEASEEDARQGGESRTHLRGSTLLLGGRLLSMSINIATEILIVRYLTKTEFGALAYALSIVTLGQTIASLGFNRSIGRFLAMYDEQRDYSRLFGTLFAVAGATAGIGLAIVAFIYAMQGILFGSLLSEGLARPLLLIVIFLTPLQAIDSLLQSIAAVFARPKAIFYRRYVVAPGLRLALALLVVLVDGGVKFLAAGYVVTALLGVLFYTGVLRHELHLRGLAQHAKRSAMSVPVQDLLVFTLPLVTTDLMYAAINSLDVLLLGHFQGADAVAALRVVWSPSHLNQIVMFTFGLLFAPLAARLHARNDEEGIRDLHWQSAVWIAVLTFPVFALTFCVADDTIETLFGERYASSGQYLAILSLGYYVGASLGFNDTTLLVYGKVRYLMVCNIAAAVTSVILNVALIPPFGALGAAVATASGHLAHTAMRQWGLGRHTGTPIFERQYTRVYATIVGAAAALFTLNQLTDFNRVIMFALAALTSLAVILVNRRLLRIGEFFPELRRFRLLRMLSAP
jgi:O-antigen/teichoic acid export membrane protein